MLAAGHSVFLLSFGSYILYFRRLISEVAWPIVTKLCHTFDGDPDFKILSEIWVSPPHPRNLAAEKNQNLARFRTTSRLDCEFRNATRRRQLENGVANYGHSRTEQLNSVFILVHKRRKIGPEFWPTYNGRPSGWALLASSCKFSTECNSKRIVKSVNIWRR